MDDADVEIAGSGDYQFEVIAPLTRVKATRQSGQHSRRVGSGRAGDQAVRSSASVRFRFKAESHGVVVESDAKRRGQWVPLGVRYMAKSAGIGRPGIGPLKVAGCSSGGVVGHWGLPSKVERATHIRTNVFVG